MAFLRGNRFSNNFEERPASALEMYRRIVKNREERYLIPLPEAVLLMVETMGKELMRYGESELLDHAWCNLKNYIYNKYNVTLNLEVKYFKIHRVHNELQVKSSYDAFMLLRTLGNYLSYQGFRSEDLAMMDRYIQRGLFDNRNVASTSEDDCYNLLIKIDNFMSRTDKGKEIYGARLISLKRASDDTKREVNAPEKSTMIEYDGQSVDTEASMNKEQVESVSSSIEEKNTVNNDVSTAVISQGKAAEYKDAPSTSVTRDIDGASTAPERASTAMAQEDKQVSTKEEERQILEAAKKLGEEIIAKAQAEAEEITANARAQADKMLAQTREQIRSQGEIRCGSRLEIARGDISGMTEGLGNLSQALTQVNESMQQLQQINAAVRQMEDMIIRENTEKAYAQMFELYSLIADTCEFMKKEISVSDDMNLINAYENMLSFMDMISEYMADYNIATLCSAPDTPFDGTRHKPMNGNAFDPHKAKVKESVRCGFLWNDVVLEKEKVLLYREDEI